MSEPIHGTFTFWPTDEERAGIPATSLLEPLSFEAAVEALITDYGAHPHMAREIVISASENKKPGFVSALIHPGIRITYSA